MAYDGKVMRLALQRFEEDRQRRQAQYQERRERIFARQPRLREIDGELRSTMSRIITSALRHGTDPRSAVAVLRDENLSLQAEKRELLQKMGLPEDALEETPACALCGDTGYRNGRVCRCLRGYYAREQQKELSRMLDRQGDCVIYAEELAENAGTITNELFSRLGARVEGRCFRQEA